MKILKTILKGALLGVGLMAGAFCVSVSAAPTTSTLVRPQRNRSSSPGIHDTAINANGFDFSESNKDGAKPMIRMNRKDDVQKQTSQEIPFSFEADEPLKLRVYRDGGD
jgi:hypothetical protein